MAIEIRQPSSNILGLECSPSLAPSNSDCPHLLQDPLVRPALPSPSITRVTVDADKFLLNGDLVKLRKEAKMAIRNAKKEAQKSSILFTVSESIKNKGGWRRTIGQFFLGSHFPEY